MSGFKYAIEPAGMSYADMGTTSDYPTWHKWPSEWPPKEGVYIVVQSGPHTETSVHGARFREGGWWTDMASYGYPDVTHWGELPEPPEE